MFKHKYISILFFGVLMGLLIVFYPSIKMFYSILIVGLLYTGVLAIGVFVIRLQFFGDNISQLNIPQKKILLTFDDGPHPTITPEILEVLKKHNAKAIFFCIGKNVVASPDIVIKIANDGHMLGNHTFNHGVYFTFLHKKFVKNEFLKCNEGFVKIGINPPRIFRPPFGVTNPIIIKAAKELNFTIIGWSNRSLDTVADTAEQILSRVIKNTKSGDIVLFHDTVTYTPKALDQYLTHLATIGYSFDCLNEFKVKLKL